METYSYDQSLEKIERFMIDTGIRRLCTDACVGHCCGNCYKSNNACHKNEGRRLTCSFWLCVYLKRLIFSKEEYSNMSSLQEYIEKEVSSITGKSRTNADVFFKRYTKKQLQELKNARFDKEMIDIIDQCDVKQISRLVGDVSVLMHRARSAHLRTIRE